MNEQWISPCGEDCAAETHRFRIGVDSRRVTEFTASKESFLSTLTNAIIEHVEEKRPGNPAQGLDIQVLCGAAKWRNLTNPKTSGVIAITNKIAGERETAKMLFGYACRAVDMSRKIETLASDLSAA